MRKISFKKLIEVTAEVPDNFFCEDGSIPTWSLARWVESNEGEYVEEDNYTQWQSNSGVVQEVRIFPKDKEYCRDEDAEVIIDQKEFDEIIHEINDADNCYECKGYGDDYDFEGNCNCNNCPSNRTKYTHNTNLINGDK